MIISEAFKEQFYNVILQAQNVVIVPYNDADSLCATFILTRLFDADEIMYSVVPVTDWNELKVVFEQHKQVNYFILLNCGGYRSLVELELPSTLYVYVLDARRPFHLDNVFESDKIRIVCQEDEISKLNLPQTSEIFEDASDNSESEEDEENDENQGLAETTERIQRRLLKKKKKSAWLDKREEIFWKYYHKSYISTPTSVVLLNIAHSMSKTNAALTWAAAVGLSSFHIDHTMSTGDYLTICMDSMKLYPRLFGVNDPNKTNPTLRVTFEKELTLPLYRNWSLDESIQLDIFFICECRLWTREGLLKLKSLYAKLGIPLNECQNNFDRLTRDRRKEISNILSEHMKTTFFTFFSHKGYARWFSSADFARAIALKLQFSDPIKPKIELFMHALKFLRDFVDQDGGSSDLMTDTLKHCKSALFSLTRLVYDCMIQKRFIQTPSFIGLTITQHCTEMDYFRSSHCLNIFAYTALQVFHGIKRSDKRRVKPFFVAILSPDQLERPAEGERVQFYLCTGCMPFEDTRIDRKTFIPRIFQELAEDTTLNTVYHSIDPNIILVREDSYADFFSRLDSRLPAIS